MIFLNIKRIKDKEYINKLRVNNYKLREMNKKSFFSVMLVVLFLAAGTSKVYCQNYRCNYFTSGKPSLTPPADFDISGFTEDEKARWDTLVGWFGEMETDDYCEEDDYFEYPTYLFGAEDENQLIDWLKANMDTVYKQDGFIVWIEFDDVYAIHLDSLIYELREYIEGEDNPFFGEEGNNLWALRRTYFKNVEGYIIPVKEIDRVYLEIEDIIEVEDEDFDLDFLSGIIFEYMWVNSYPYYELLDEDDDNKSLVKDGDEELYNDCMGYTGIKEIQQTADIKIYPNPANGRVTLSFPSYMTEDEGVNVEIFNILGKTVLSHHASGNQIDMDIDSLPAGIYVVRCVKDDKVISKRFVKQ